MELLDDNKYKDFGTKPVHFTQKEWKTRKRILVTRLERQANLSIFDPEYELLIDWWEGQNEQRI